MDTGPQSDPITAEPLEDPFERRRREAAPATPVRPELEPAVP